MANASKVLQRTTDLLMLIKRKFGAKGGLAYNSMTALSVAYKAKQEHCLYVAFQDVEHFK
jgi:hypothetical protein